ncbi:NitT/TauT family transport system ATP-binding protein [Rhodococcus sp. 27YEA15]|uniref:ABC transporter ATP-binding protein n=1 Tax=Rhodococcus sp. 27YEA15 TaxID=3156259 RepID=UPI003C7CA89E
MSLTPLQADREANTVAAHERIPGPEAVAVSESAELSVELRNVSQVFPTKTGPFTAIKDVNLDVRKGEFLSIVGPSGCGKSTLVGLVAGLTRPYSGEVRVLGENVTGVDKRVGVIFQKDALLPWRTTLQNVALPLRWRGASKSEANDKAREWLKRVGLEGFESNFPHQLSGGMRKRVSIASTMSYRPEVLLMDEPFSALDVQTRNIMENDLLDLWAGSGQTVIFITHDLEEAIGMSDRVVSMTASPGTVLNSQVVDLPRPRDILECRLTPEFGEIHRQIWDDLRGEVLAAHKR